MAIGLSLPLSGSTGGSTNNSASSGYTTAQANSSNYSQTFGSEATSAARANMEYANKLAYENWLKAAEYNSKEAEKQRQWQENMAATNYQRTVKDMIAAGINPVLAAGAGLGADTVSSGSAASMASPSTFMAGAYADQISSGTSASESYGENHAYSHGESWEQSGLATGLGMLATAIQGVVENMNSSGTVERAVEGIQELKKEFSNASKSAQETLKSIGTTATNIAGKVTGHFVNDYSGNHSGGGHKFTTEEDREKFVKDLITKKK